MCSAKHSELDRLKRIKRRVFHSSQAKRNCEFAHDLYQIVVVPVRQQVLCIPSQHPLRKNQRLLIMLAIALLNIVVIQQCSVKEWSISVLDWVSVIKPFKASLQPSVQKLKSMQKSMFNLQPLQPILNDGCNNHQWAGHLESISLNQQHQERFKFNPHTIQ